MPGAARLDGLLRARSGREGLAHGVQHVIGLDAQFRIGLARDALLALLQRLVVLRRALDGHRDRAIIVREGERSDRRAAGALLADVGRRGLQVGESGLGGPIGASAVASVRSRLLSSS
ncbi:hypothetical protein D3C85_866170 [compost metagenome]